MKTMTLFAAIIASTATFAPAAAEPVAVSTVVHIADLDLASQIGQAKLDQRLAQAAREVCGTASPADLEGDKNVRHCRQQTVAAAVAQREQLLAAARAGTPIRVAAAR